MCSYLLFDNTRLSGHLICCASLLWMLLSLLCYEIRDSDVTIKTIFLNVILFFYIYHVFVKRDAEKPNRKNIFLEVPYLCAYMEAMSRNLGGLWKNMSKQE